VGVKEGGSTTVTSCHNFLNIHNITPNREPQVTTLPEVKYGALFRCLSATRLLLALAGRGSAAKSYTAAGLTPGRWTSSIAQSNGQQLGRSRRIEERLGGNEHRNLEGNEPHRQVLLTLEPLVPQGRARGIGMKHQIAVRLLLEAPLQ
jgi:hypothetical protein